MSRQTFVSYFVADGTLRDHLRRALRVEGFEVTEAVAGGLGLAVRVRQDTADVDRVEQIVRRLAPGARRGPETVPTVHIEGYRKRR